MTPKPEFTPGAGPRSPAPGPSKAPSAADRNILEISELERLSLERRSPAERFTSAVAFHAGRFWFIVLHAVWFGLWAGWNSGVVRGAFKFDPYPFNALNTALAIESIFLSLFLLISQNRSNRRADERAHLALQVNLLAEHETTKLLHLVQALCAFHNLPEARDPEVAEMMQRTEPADLARELERQLSPENAPTDITPDPID